MQSDFDVDDAIGNVDSDLLEGTDVFSSFSDLQHNQSRSRFRPDVRRALEQLKEDKELDRLINGNFYGWD
ncbi:PA3496 family putative envelope integrity protein [Pseudomonadota bacterium]